MTNNITTIGEPIKPIITCTYCIVDTVGNHANNCPCRLDDADEWELMDDLSKLSKGIYFPVQKFKP